MARTRYDEERGEFTKAAHKAARTQFYPKLFDVPRENLEFRDVDESDDPVLAEFDLQHGIDKIIAVDSGETEFPPVFSVQERFREPQYRHYRDITITQFNKASGRVSEAGKMVAELFVYGYYDDVLDQISEAIAVNVLRLNLARLAGTIGEGAEENDKEQDFITIKFDELRHARAVVHHEIRAPLRHSIHQQKKLDESGGGRA